MRGITSAAKHDHFLLSPDKLMAGNILAMDRAYIDYEKFEQMTQRGVIYGVNTRRCRDTDPTPAPPLHGIPSRGGERLRAVFRCFFVGVGFSEWTSPAISSRVSANFSVG